MKYIRKSEMATALTISRIVSLPLRSFFPWHLKIKNEKLARFCSTLVLDCTSRKIKYVLQMNERNRKLDSTDKCVVLKIPSLKHSRKKPCLKTKKILFYFSIKFKWSKILFHINMFSDPKSCEWNLRCLKRSCLFL